jgi:hypothetical protein
MKREEATEASGESELEPYEEPTLEDVPLNPEETMLAPCKSTGGAGFNTAGCRVHLGGPPCRRS